MTPLQPVPIPPHYSADVGYKTLRPLLPYLQSAKQMFMSGNPVTAAQGKQMLTGLARIVEGIQQAYDGGELDGDATWKALAGDTLAQLNTFATNVSPIMIAYSNQAGQLVAQRAQDVANGAQLPLITSDEALEQITMAQADVDAVVAELVALGV